MARTKSQAIKKANLFKEQHPSRDVQIVEHLSLKKNSPFRFNYRFPKKKGKKNQIIFLKER